MRGSHLMAVIVGTSWLAGACHAQNMLQNGDFEELPVLGPGQSDVAAGASKPIARADWEPDYFNAVYGVSNWTVGIDEGREYTDAGPSREHAFSGQRSVYLNHGQRRFSQRAGIVEAGISYTATISVGLFVDPSIPLAGELQLWPGEVIGETDQFSHFDFPFAVLSFATPAWGGPAPDILLSQTGWTTASVSGMVDRPDWIGRPLTFTYIHAEGSMAPVFLDAASLIPGSGTLAALACGIAVTSRRNRS